MNRTHPPCGTCARFIPAKAGIGHCEVDGQPKQADEHPCPLYLEWGSREARLAAKSSRELLAELQRRNPVPAQRGMLASQVPQKQETISRASAHRSST